MNRKNGWHRVVAAAQFALVASAALVALPILAGCGPSVDYENIDGVARAEDELFRFVDYPETARDEAFTALERMFRLHFSGSRIVIDRESHSLETQPLAFASAPQRVTVYGQVSVVDTAARVELFAKVERLRDDVRKDPTQPWKYMGADARLENQLFEELWDALVVSKRLDDGSAPPAVPEPGRSGGESGDSDPPKDPGSAAPVEPAADPGDAATPPATGGGSEP